MKRGADSLRLVLMGEAISQGIRSGKVYPDRGGRLQRLHQVAIDRRWTAEQFHAEAVGAGLIHPPRARR